MAFSMLPLWYKVTLEFRIYSSNYKSDNLQYNTLGRWDNCLIDQASDVPSLILFHNFLQNSLQKILSIYVLTFFITLQK